jgi:hypothetical protein
VQQRGGLERGLAGADHDHVLVLERGQVGVGRAVRAHRGRQRGQRLGNVREGLDADGDDHLARPDLLGVRQRQLETAAGLGYVGDQHLFDVGHQRVAEPLAVGHERVQRHRQAVVGVGAAGRPAEGLERMRVIRVGQVRREALRLEEHALGHEVTP